jgi:RNA polymerase sigma-70 factor (ECF subfamily)
MGNEGLAPKFEENRSRLRAVAYRMLGSMNQAEDAVQEAWLRLSRSDASSIESIEAWLTTVVAHVCLDILRARKSRREETVEDADSRSVENRPAASDPEREALLADSVGLALLVILDRLNPAERLAFVLHDMFAVGFDEIASIIGRSPTAVRQLASRARRRVQGGTTFTSANVHEQRKIVDSFLSALRAGDVERLMNVLDPDALVRIDAASARPGAPREIHGAGNWARAAIAFSRSAGPLQNIELALIDGRVGLMWAPAGRLSRVLRFAFKGAKIIEVDIIADPASLGALDLAVLPSA